MNEVMLMGAVLLTAGIALLVIGTLLLLLWHIGVVRKARKGKKKEGFR